MAALPQHTGVLIRRAILGEEGTGDRSQAATRPRSRSLVGQPATERPLECLEGVRLCPVWISDLGSPELGEDKCLFLKPISLWCIVVAVLGT